MKMAARNTTKLCISLLKQTTTAANHHTTAQAIRASPLTYKTGGKQYVSVVATATILTFALP